MNVALRKVMTLAEFLAWEERQELRHEFDGARPVAMTGGTANHSEIQGNINFSLKLRLRGKSCKYYGSDFKFITAEGTARYTDGMVVCTPVKPKSRYVETPTVVFEVLSPSTAHIDRIDKAREYEATPSVMRYVMLEQDSIGAVVYARVNGVWTHALLKDGEILALPELGFEFPLAELYQDVVFDDPEAEPA